MNEVMQIVTGLFTSVLFVVIPGFVVAIAQTKKAIKTGPRILSYDGDLRLTQNDYIVIFLLSWVVAVVAGVLTAIGMAGAGQPDIMKWAFIAAGVASYLFSKRQLRTKVFAIYEKSSNQT